MEDFTFSEKMVHLGSIIQIFMCMIGIGFSLIYATESIVLALLGVKTSSK